MQFHHSVAAATLLLALAGTLAHAQSQAFTYQGELRSGNNLAQGDQIARARALQESFVRRIVKELAPAAAARTADAREPDRR